MKYNTAYGTRNKVFTEPGRQMQNEYGYEIKGTGEKVLVKTGETNLYEMIQAEHEQTKIESVLARVAAGDMSDFRPQGIYQDVTQIPNNFIEAQREMQKVTNIWNKLPTEIKAKYNNDVNQYMAQAGTEAWLKDSGFINENATETPVKLESEVKNAAEGKETNEKQQT